MTLDASGVLLVGRTGASGFGKLNVDGGADLTGGNVLMCRDTGNVGIGTSSPATKLHIVQTTDSNTDGVRVARSGNTAQYGMFSNYGGATWLTAVDTANLGNNITVFNRSANGSTFTESMRLDSSGNLLVGATSGLGAATANGLYVQSGSYVAGGQVTQLLGYWMSNANDNNGQGGVGIQYYRVPRGGGVQTGTEIRFYTGYSYTPSTTAQVGTFDQNGNFSVLSGNISVGLGGSYNPVAVYIGTETNGATAQGGVGINGGGTAQVDIGHASGTSSGTSYTRYIYNGAVIGSITQNGTTAVAYNTSSDYRLKNNPQPLTGSGAFIDALQPKTWTWVQDGSRGAGFIAHEFAEVSPTSVTGEKDAVDDDGNPKYQGMQASAPEVIANLVAEIQSLRKRVAQLESK
jgi:hypothetical protein